MERTMDLKECSKGWFAVQVRPKYEFITATILRNKGYEEFVPSYRSVRQWSDRRKEITAPLFPGYVFCRFNAEICAPVVTTPGVIRILGTANRSAQIEDSEIEAIQMAVASGLNLLPFPYINVGDRVCIKEGPMAGLQGILIRCNNRHRFILSVDLIQNSLAVEIDESEIVKMNDVPNAVPAAHGAVMHEQNLTDERRFRNLTRRTA
jgi:transcription termination/antitermination protein NusG